MIGAKTLATAALFVAAVVAALAFGVIAPERIAGRGWGTLFLVGAFAIVVGTLVYRFWRLDEKSRHYFRWTAERSPWKSADEAHFLGGERRRILIGDNRGEAFDLPPRLQHALCVGSALVLALACIDARALGLLDRFEQSLSSATSAAYCPEPEAAAATATVDPNEPGCELIRRAVALGYAKSLGACAPRAAAAPVATRAPCQRRQRDEPLFHYAWRLLSRAWIGLRAHTHPEYFSGMRKEFDARVGQLGSFSQAQRQTLASAPHASHHIWTNLPDPGKGAFSPHGCADRYLKLGHRPAADASASQVFEHVVAQLLFEGRYEPAAGACREYHVHWGAPLDTCKRLAENPEAVLEEAAALGEVRGVLDRHRLSRALRGAELRAPAAYVSFQCYFEAPGAAAVAPGVTMTLDGAQFPVAEVHVAPAASALFIDRYQAVARTLVQGFHYGALLSEAGLDAGSPEGLQAAFAGRDYLISRVYGLDSLDIYLDPGFLAQRPDLMEVYPYERHLKNFVQIFRRQYRRERGRL